MNAPSGEPAPSTLHRFVEDLQVLIERAEQQHIRATERARQAGFKGGSAEVHDMDQAYRYYRYLHRDIYLLSLQNLGPGADDGDGDGDGDGESNDGGQRSLSSAAQVSIATRPRPPEPDPW